MDQHYISYTEWNRGWESEDPYTRGWLEADNVIRDKQTADLSQGETEWDRGWNERVYQDLGK